MSGHALAIHVEFDRPLPAERARELLTAAPGVNVVELPLLEATGPDGTFVGRIRQDQSVPDGAGLVLFVVADNLLGRCPERHPDRGADRCALT